MRLHRLEITAFGPFADTVTVDFDALSEAGLFLLSGPTGSGKTSVLDAVCFALYGDVPGDRAVAKRLRCDQADPMTRPLVTLEATLSGRRFRLVRSPSWSRPKKRGTGTTTEQASVTVSERVDDEWVCLTSRLDEAGQLVSGLVGMTLTQFTQVAMLPQGRFQAFLRARSEDRQRLLQQLFRTGRFAQVEAWLREHRSALRRDLEAAHRGLADVVSRVSEAAEAPLPGDWDVHDLALPARAGEIGPWLEELHERARLDSAAALDALRAEATVEVRARAELESARTAHERRARYDEARARHEELLAGADAHRDAVRTLEAARRAAAVAPLGPAVDEARRRRTGAEADLAERLAALGTDPERLPGLVRERSDAAARVRALLPRAGRVTELLATAADLAARRAGVAADLEAVEVRLAEAPAELARLRAEAAEAAAARTALEGVRLRLETVTERLAAHTEAAELAATVERARADLMTARDTAQQLREHWLTIREARLEGMAAEIAGALTVGASCPVCGSADHPAKARPAPDAPDAEDERAALRAVDDAKAAEHLADVELRDLEARLGRARQLAGDDPPDRLAGEKQTLTAELDRLTGLAERADDLAQQAEEVGSRVQADTETRQRLRVEDAELERTLAGVDDERERLESEVAAELAGTDHDSLDDLLAEHERVATLAAEALAARDELRAAERELARAEEALAAAAEAAGFPDPATALAASLTPAEIDGLAERTAAHERRLAAVEAVLAEPGADDRTPLPDLDERERAHAAALDRLGDRQAAAAVAATRVGRLAELRSDLQAALERWRPLRERLELTDRLASFVEGRSPDNRLQMRLSAYVLAYRLTQVVAAANARLARMSDRRYSLEHTGRRGAGESRGGLSLLVRDDWSGESRDPATLSGGETFVVSLALALGLADVITQEAGGAELDTLFVDEGFGSLDADTLDDVMDTLDSLRDGGRVVGVVSHVAEMRDRIPARLEVTKSRRGSRVSIVR